MRRSDAQRSRKTSINGGESVETRLLAASCAVGQVPPIGPGKTKTDPPRLEVNDTPSKVNKHPPLPPHTAKRQ